MDMNYGCDVSNRYTGYLDSSDHGNSMGSSTGKNKRKTKKKRKSKNHQMKIDKCTDTTELIDVEKNDEIEETQQPSSLENKDDHNVNDEFERPEMSTNSIDGLSSLQSYCDSPMQLDTSKESKESIETAIEHNGMIVGETKWSVICFEEEKDLLSNKSDDQTFVNEPEMQFKDQRIYPTVYFYNSKYGDNTRRVVYNDHHNRNHRPKHNNEPVESTDGRKDKRRQNRNGKNRRKFSSKEKEKGDTREVHSVDEKHIDSHNESADRVSQQTESNKQELTKNRYNKFKHGSIPERTFRRRTDFVRNV